MTSNSETLKQLCTTVRSLLLTCLGRRLHHNLEMWTHFFLNSIGYHNFYCIMCIKLYNEGLLILCWDKDEKKCEMDTNCVEFGLITYIVLVFFRTMTSLTAALGHISMYNLPGDDVKRWNILTATTLRVERTPHCLLPVLYEHCATFFFNAGMWEIPCWGLEVKIYFGITT